MHISKQHPYKRVLRDCVRTFTQTEQISRKGF